MYLQSAINMTALSDEPLIIYPGEWNRSPAALSAYYKSWKCRKPCLPETLLHFIWARADELVVSKGLAGVTRSILMRTMFMEESKNNFSSVRRKLDGENVWHRWMELLVWRQCLTPSQVPEEMIAMCNKYSSARGVFELAAQNVCSKGSSSRAKMTMLVSQRNTKNKVFALQSLRLSGHLLL